MTLEERSNLVLAFARVLYVNGQSTDDTLASAERFGDTFGLRAKIMPRWGELELQAEDGDSRLVSAIEANPAGVDMDRVVSAMQALEDLGTGRLAPTAAMETISTISALRHSRRRGQAKINLRGRSAPGATPLAPA